MKIEFKRSKISKIDCSRKEKYHGSSFLYVDGAFYIQEGKSGGTPEIVSRKLERWEKNMEVEIEKNGIHSKEVDPEIDLYLPF